MLMRTPSRSEELSISASCLTVSRTLRGLKQPILHPYLIFTGMCNLHYRQIDLSPNIKYWMSGFASSNWNNFTRNHRVSASRHGRYRFRHDRTLNRPDSSPPGAAHRTPLRFGSGPGPWCVGCENRDRSAVNRAMMRCTTGRAIRAADLGARATESNGNDDGLASAVVFAGAVGARTWKGGAPVARTWEGR